MIMEEKIRSVVRDEMRLRQVGGDRSTWYDALRQTDIEFRYWDRIIGSVQPMSLFPLQALMVRFYELVKSYEKGGENYESEEDA